MSKIRLLKRILGLTVAMVLLIGCPQPTPIVIVVTATSQIASSTVTKDTPTVVNSSPNISLSGTVGSDIDNFSPYYALQYKFEMKLKNSGSIPFHFVKIVVSVSTKTTTIRSNSLDITVGEVLQGAPYSSLDVGKEISFDCDTDGWTYNVIDRDVPASEQNARIVVVLLLPTGKTIGFYAPLPDLKDLSFDKTVPLTFVP